MFIMLVIKCVPQQTYTTTFWKQRINMCYSVCQIGWDCYKHGNRHPKGLKCSSCWSLNVCPATDIHHYFLVTTNQHVFQRLSDWLGLL